MAFRLVFQFIMDEYSADLIVRGDNKRYAASIGRKLRSTHGPLDAHEDKPHVVG